jgi:DNA replication protein DnaC
MQRIDTTDLQATLSRLRDRFATGAESPVEAKAYDDRRHARAVQSIGLPSTIEAALLSRVDESNVTLRVTDAYQQLSDAAKKKKRIIALSGKPGTGKSYAAAWWCVDSLECTADNGDVWYEPRACWVSSADFVALAPWSWEVRAYRYVPCLAVDDVGLEEKRQRGRIEQLIYDRHAAGNMTVLTTNLDGMEFKAAYNERVASRMREVGSWRLCKEVVRPGEA